MNTPTFHNRNPYFSVLQNESLISVGQIYDDGCQSILNKKYLQVLDNDKTLILTGKRNKPDGLRDIPMAPRSQPSQAANKLFQMKKTNKELDQFLHASCFIPAPSTFIQAIKIFTSPLVPDLQRTSSPSTYHFIQKPQRAT